MKTIPWEVERADLTERLTEVTPRDGGWEIGVGSTYFVAKSTECDVTPTVGETLKLIGGWGYPIRGIEIGGRCYLYLTAEEEAERHRQWVAGYHAEKQKEADDQRAIRDAKVAAMPPFFRKRIERFREVSPDFRRDAEGYEIFCCEQAIVFQEALKTVEALQAFAQAPYEEQKRLVPGLDDGHSGNTFGAAVALARFAMQAPELVPAAHGALCPLVGCKDYGCWAAHEGTSEPPS